MEHRTISSFLQPRFSTSRFFFSFRFSSFFFYFFYLSYSVSIIPHRVFFSFSTCLKLKPKTFILQFGSDFFFVAGSALAWFFRDRLSFWTKFFVFQKYIPNTKGRWIVPLLLSFFFFLMILSLLFFSFSNFVAFVFYTPFHFYFKSTKSIERPSILSTTESREKKVIRKYIALGIVNFLAFLFYAMLQLQQYISFNWLHLLAFSHEDKSIR